MTVEELKEYYDKGGASRLQGMDAKGKQNMFLRFTVSKLLKESPLFLTERVVF